MNVVFLALAMSMPSVEAKSVESGGYTWEYVFAKPAGQAKGLILAMHGAGGSGPQFAESAQWPQKATAAGFAVICPSGLPSRPNAEPSFATNPRVWNSGQLNPRSQRVKVDDLAALDKMIQAAFKEIGKAPLFVTGHSNGAGMTFRVAYEWAGRVQTIGMMSGIRHFPLDKKPPTPIPTLWIVGEKDPLSPFEGGTTKMPVWGTEKDNPPVVESAGEWAAWMDGKGGMASKTESGGVVRMQFGKSVQVWECLGHGHGWPGGKKGELPASIIGPEVAKIDATAELLKFFAAHLD